MPRKRKPTVNAEDDSTENTAGADRQEHAPSVVGTSVERALETERLLSPLPEDHHARVAVLMEALANAAADEDEEEAEAEADSKSFDHGLGNVVAEYNMYINNPGKRLMLLQYPNRDPGQSYSDKTGQKPLELRIKPKSGLVEVDIPLSVHAHFDKNKSLQFGEAMRKSRTLQDGGSYGLYGGLKAGVGGPSRGRSRTDEQEFEEPALEPSLMDFDDANQRGYVMNKLVLGGHIVPWKDGDPIYMIGVFKGSRQLSPIRWPPRNFSLLIILADCVFLNKLDAIVQLRPQFNHLDALGDLDRTGNNPRSKGGVETSIEEPQARAVNLTVKSTDVEDLDLYGDMSENAKLLKTMREEPWQRLTWVDSEV